LISGGRLRFEATVKRQNATDNLGKKQTDFTVTVGTFRCDLRDVGSTEVEYAGAPTMINSFEVYARWNAISELGLVPRDRLIIRGRTFSILGVRNEAERDRLATITVEELA